MLQRVHRGVADPEQAWILAELIRYLEHPRSGALDFTDMGGAWVAVRESVLAGTLRANDKGAIEVVSRWDQLLRFAALRLERDLGSGVQVSLSRREQADPTIRPAALLNELVSKGTLSGSLRVPNTVGELMITADVRTGRCTIEVDVAAPGDGRPLTRVNWLLRQLGDAHEAVRVDAFAHMARTSVSGLLKAVRADPTTLLGDPKADLRRFRVAATSQLGTKRGSGVAASSIRYSGRSTASTKPFCRASARGLRRPRSCRSRALRSLQLASTRPCCRTRGSSMSSWTSLSRNLTASNNMAWTPRPPTTCCSRIRQRQARTISSSAGTNSRTTFVKSAWPASALRGLPYRTSGRARGLRPCRIRAGTQRQPHGRAKRLRLDRRVECAGSP